MELEIGFKITHAGADLTSTSNLRIKKDQSSPVFLSRETETMFILIAYLKGFRRDDIGIKINEDGTRITISWKRPIREIVMRGWNVYKEVEMKGFTKAFRIPNGVVLDRIKAKFNEDDSELTISMPKLVRGIQGLNIEELDQGEESEPAKVIADKVIGDDMQSNQEPLEKGTDDDEEEHEVVAEDTPIADAHKEETKEVVQERDCVSQDIEKYDEPAGREKVRSETQQENQLEGAAPQREESPSPTAVYSETVEPEEVETETKIDDPTEDARSPPTQEIVRREEPHSIDQPTKAVEDRMMIQLPQVSSPTPVRQDEKKDEALKVGEMTQEQKPEPCADVQEPKKLGYNQESEQTETPTPVPAPAPDDETKGAENEIEEEEKGQADLPEEAEGDEHEAQEVEKQNDQPGKKHGSKSSLLCAPIIIAGSAIIVSLFVFVVHLIRTKKR